MNRDEPTAGRMEGQRHLLPVRIYYEDTDFTGLVYHANYLRYFERGRSDFLRVAGVDHSALLRTEPATAFTIIAINLNFLKPARVDDALVVETRLAKLAGPRLTFSQSLHKDEQVLARAEVEACCITLTGRPKKPPAELAAALKPFLDPSVSTF